jgi:hypothetical protein
MATEYVKFKLRRDTAANIDLVVLADGEPAFCTDTKEFRVGDGTTSGGNPIGGSTSVSTTTSTGNQDNFDTSGAGILVCNNATTLTLRGILAGSAGKELLLIAKGAGAVYLNNEDSNSTAANRILTRFVTANSLVIASGGSARLWYDTAAARWVVVDWTSGVPSGPLNYTELQRNTDQTAATATATYASFNNEVSNVWGVFSSGNPTRLTVPTGQGGLWQFTVRFWANESLTGQVQMGARKNGSDFLFVDDRYMSGSTMQNTLTFSVSLAAGDYLEFYYYQASGGDKTFQIPLATAVRLG